MKKAFTCFLVLGGLSLFFSSSVVDDRVQLFLFLAAGIFLFIGGFGLLRLKRHSDAAAQKAAAEKAAAERVAAELAAAERIYREVERRSSVSPTSVSSSPAPTISTPPASSFPFFPKPDLSVRWKDSHFAEVLSMRDFCVLDVETTGLDFSRDRIVQIGIIKVVDNQPMDNLNTYINPEIPIPSRSTEIHGITDADVKDAPTYKQIADRVLSLMNSTTVVGHNVTFDLNFVQRIFPLCSDPDVNIKIDYIDTWEYAHRVLPRMPDYKLQTLLAFYGIDPGEAHTAYDDARATLELFNSLRYEYAHKDEIEAQRKAAELEARRQKKEAEKAARAAAFSASPLFEKSFCFTGSFSIDRAAMEALAQSVGGVLREKISGRTSYLVKGDVSDLPDWALDRKLHKAEELIEAGKGIQIIDEAEFMRLIADAKNVLSTH